MYRLHMKSKYTIFDVVQVYNNALTDLTRLFCSLVCTKRVFERTRQYYIDVQLAVTRLSLAL